MDYNQITQKIEDIGGNYITISYLQATEEDDSLYDVFVNVWPNKSMKRNFETIVVKTDTSMEKAESISKRLHTSLGRVYDDVHYTGLEA
ncbi:hypothetical protein DXT76_20090 [Halobacillus trueperi]|uniref:Uncharacterized protein n=2 Tax=Halobacillus TaxID=45667 RepID=A0A1H0QQ74_HALAD|nr:MULTISPECIES: hypothetical protein [Halobacillus]RDY66959.1 hypothetical protein DXT76_20090 [Halobacillus trueperi]SDP19265.1 hypothetical protein SAMN05421677_11382 [Halobacillus aidingensis]